MLALLLLAAGYVSPITPDFGSNGTGATTGNVSVTVPSGIANNDILLLWACSRETGTNAHSITVASGWAAVNYSGGGGINTFNTSTQCSLWWKRTTGTEASNPTVSRSTTTTAISAFMMVWRGVVTTGNPWEASSSAFSSATATPLATSAITSLTNDGVILHLYGAGITTNSAPTWGTRSGAATRGLGSSDAASVVNNGSSTNRSGVGGAYDVLPVAASTGTSSVVFGGGTGTRVGVLLALKPQSGNNPQVWDPIQQPPNAKDIQGVDITSHALLVQDQNPSGSGDIVGLVRTNAGSDTWYLLVSTDAGASWSYITATGAGAATLANNPIYHAICQDTVSYKIHALFADQNVSPVYHRIALTYTSSHVTGWTWDTADIAGPAFDAAGDATDVAAHVDLKEVIDPGGTHVLVAAAVDQPSTANLLSRLVVARTTNLSPTGSSSWFKITAHTTVGVDVLLRKFSSAGSDGGTLPRDVFSRPTNEANHQSDATFAQIVNDSSLHFFVGEMFYNDTNVGASHLERFRFTSNGTDWVLDSSTGNGVSVSTSSSIQAQPCMGNASASNNYVWFTYGDAAGMHISKIDTSGTWTTDAFTSPDSSTGASTGVIWWNSAVTVRSDEQIAYLSWARYDVNASQFSRSKYFVAYYDSSWHTTDITIPFNVPNSSFNYQMGMWTYVYGMPNSIGVLTYPYKDWSTASHHYYTMIYTGPIPPAGAVPPGIPLRMRTGFGR